MQSVLLKFPFTHISTFVIPLVQQQQLLVLVLEPICSSSAASLPSRSYGFVSFLESMDALSAMKDMNGKYIGNRPVRIKRADQDEKSVSVVKKKDAERVSRAKGNR